MRSKFLIGVLIIIYALLISTGGVIAAFRDVITSARLLILLSALPLTALILCAAILNLTILIPRLLIPQRYFSYIVWCWLMSMMIPLGGLSMEYAIRLVWGFPVRIHDYFSFWVAVDSFSTASLLTVIFLGMGVRRIYREWRKETAEEERASKECSEVIELYNNRIKASEILMSLRQINVLAKTSAEEANVKLRNLSTTLRHELYDMPMLNIGQCSSKVSNPRLLKFISDRLYSGWRNFCLTLLIASISITAIFDTPDLPNLTIRGLWAFLGMFLIIWLVTYGNKSLCRYFIHKGKIKSYIIGCGIFLGIMTIAMIIVESISYVNTIHNGRQPLVIDILATLSSFCTLTLYLCGVTSLVLLNYWLQTEHRTIRLKAETTKTELQFLKSQINPHFLFNVLNNIGILIYEVPIKASQMLNQLSEMFEYQMKITHQPMIELSEEVDFLRNFLLLERSRKSHFHFSLMVDEGIEGIRIPSLLFIPFVENASKHSNGNRDILINIYLDKDKICFICSNTVEKPTIQKGLHRGLGITNTRRRLDLLYGSEYSLSIDNSESMYKITLRIPVNYEMYNS